MATELDYIEQGSGEAVFLLHSTAAGNKQWRKLIDELSPCFKVIAPNLIGYGSTPHWTEQRLQTLNDQVALLDDVFQRYQKFSIVGHSFGGSVAMTAAKNYPEKVKDLVLIEPNPFYLLEQNSDWEAFDEAVALRDIIKTAGNTDSWEIAATYFADYWNGAGSWQGMDQQRQTKFITALKPNFHEWDCVMHEKTSLDEWRMALPSDTTILSSDKTVNSISSLVGLFKTCMSSWSFQSYSEAGHMAPLTHPQMINPIINNILLKT